MPKSYKGPKIHWICELCGISNGRWYKSGYYIGPDSHFATYHRGTCELCGAKDVAVTQPRDFGGLV